MSSETIEILLIDDDEDDFVVVDELVSTIYPRKFHLDWVASFEEGMAAIEANEYDVYLVDFHLGWRNGIELVRQAIGNGCDGIFIMLTGQENPGLDIEAMTVGCADYLDKYRLNRQVLERSIRYSIERKLNERALRKARDELEIRVRERTAELELTNCSLAESEKRLHDLVQALRKAHDEMENRIQERTRELELANEALTDEINERRKAEEARDRVEIDAQRRRDELAHVTRVATMGELSSSLAHELGQPLTGILSNAQAARRFLDLDNPDIEEVRSALDDIADDCARAGGVIDRLRLILKKKRSERNALDLNLIVRETLRLVASDALRKKISVECELVHDLPLVTGDRIQLQQVLINLVLNGFDAIAHAEGGLRRVVVLTRCDSGSVVVMVRDTGPGVDPEHLDSIFDPFFTTKINGLGMGLCISRYILEAQGGRLWAVRNPDRGMSFCFSLPAREP